MRPMTAGKCWLLPVVFLSAQPALAATTTTDEIEELRLLLKIQQAEIKALQRAVESQQVVLEAQQKLLQAASDRQAPPNPPDQPDVPAPPAQPAVLTQTDEKTEPPETADATETDALENVTGQSTALTASTGSAADEHQPADDAPERPAASKEDTSFAGSWPLTDTNARLRIGGYVKMAIIDNLDPLSTKDRFIVGTIPPEGTKVSGAEGDVTLSVAQSRLNLELRDKSRVGDLRAFIEGDFAGSGDTFRLRHAFGQFRSVLAGKTWSTLMDLESGPEEVDFEGINGRINVRQAQLRFFPKINESVNMSLSLEDPSPEVSGGTGISQIPDIVVGVHSFSLGVLHRLNSRQRWRVRLAVILRNIQARETQSSSKESTMGWGLTVSGHVATPFWAENDKILWQLTYGDGVGRYINDLGTIGGQDAIFSPSGNLQTWPVFAGYASYQHWWRPRWRSSLTFSWVKVDAYGFQSTPSYIAEFGAPYERTLRTNVNLLFNPIPRVELGAELLWGERRNANDTKGDAKQIQVSAKYGF